MRIGLTTLVIVAASVTCSAAAIGMDTDWTREDFTGPGARSPTHSLPAKPRLTAEMADGVFRLVDGGSESGDLLAFSRSWCADPVDGAACRASVKVVRCAGLAGVMLGFSDGVHEDILTLYEDRIELYRAGLKHAMDTTDTFHEYQVEIRGTDVLVSADGRQIIAASGTFTYPAHNGRNRFSFGSGASASQGESLWQWVAWTNGLEAARRTAPVIAGAEQVVVYRKEGVYAPFPALRRDPRTGQLYVVFSKKTTRTHYETLDSTRGRMTSRDGGRTWEEAQSMPAGLVAPRPEEVATAQDGSRIRIGQNWRRWYPPERRAEFEGKYSISTPGTYKPDWFAVTSGGWAQRSDDDGKTWQKTAITELDTYVSCSSPWSYMQLRDGRLVRAFMARSGPDDSGDVFAAFTHDGRTAETMRVMGDPDEQLRFTEETLVHETSDGAIWMLTRVEGGDDHLWQGVSRDGGRTWHARKTGVKGHPPSGLVALRDGRLVLSYGYRHPPYGIRAVISNDEGLTWDMDNVVVLRNDGAGYDLGYPRSMQLEDGTILTVYYFTDDEKVTHIACTRWRAPQ
jgi:sialidase-1